MENLAKARALQFKLRAMTEYSRHVVGSIGIGSIDGVPCVNVYFKGPKPEKELPTEMDGVAINYFFDFGEPFVVSE